MNESVKDHRLVKVPGYEGLSQCTVCGGAEGTLTSHCPGTKMPAILGELVHKGTIDYYNHEWREVSLFKGIVVRLGAQFHIGADNPAVIVFPRTPGTNYVQLLNRVRERLCNVAPYDYETVADMLGMLLYKTRKHDPREIVLCQNMRTIGIADEFGEVFGADRVSLGVIPYIPTGSYLGQLKNGYVYQIQDEQLVRKQVTPVSVLSAEDFL